MLKNIHYRIYIVEKVLFFLTKFYLIKLLNDSGGELVNLSQIPSIIIGHL